MFVFPQLSGKDQDIKSLPFISNGVVLCVPNHWSLVLSFIVILRFIDLGCQDCCLPSTEKGEERRRECNTKD